MSNDHDATRRTFLTVAAGAGGTLILSRDVGHSNAELGFVQATAHPLAHMRCILNPGAIPTGSPVKFTLTLDGPAFSAPEIVAEQRTVLTSEPLVWPVQLSYAHPNLIPGRYVYRASAEVNHQRLVSEPVEYILRPFRFGV